MEPCCLTFYELGLLLEGDVKEEETMEPRLEGDGKNKVLTILELGKLLFSFDKLLNPLVDVVEKEQPKPGRHQPRRPNQFAHSQSSSSNFRSGPCNKQVSNRTHNPTRPNFWSPPQPYCPPGGHQHLLARTQLTLAGHPLLGHLLNVPQLQPDEFEDLESLLQFIPVNQRKEMTNLRLGLLSERRRPTGASSEEASAAAVGANCWKPGCRQLRKTTAEEEGLEFDSDFSRQVRKTEDNDSLRNSDFSRQYQLLIDRSIEV
ncbi:hypothetical protein E3N88_14101 [Mikania micrantha]|uniref:Uncharacterized protein n=1 Tax=Mikania micrantha TaxID=192012 RepID=A0A5N6P274_9ASTR|nr:hypothetical protein E3N88_14101 [Mikania micrantha]